MNRQTLYRRIVGATVMCYSEPWSRTFTTTFTVVQRTQLHGEKGRNIVVRSLQGHEERMPFESFCQAIERGDIHVTYPPAL